MYTRHSDGTITQTGSPVATGGNGAASEPPFGFPIVDSSGSTNITPDGKLLFVVNAGDNSVSSFKTTAAGPVLVSHVSSGGTLPISLTSHGNLLYVVNEESANIKGWTFDSSGHLSPIAGSVQSLSVPFNPASPPSGVAAAIGFSPNGNQLVVTASIPCFARRSCATRVIAALLPPWLVTITSFRMPARATLSPSAIQSCNASSVESVSVPG